MATNTPHTKQNRKKEKEDKEAKEAEARIRAQAAKKKAKSEELQIQAKNAPIPKLEEIPEGGEWKGAGMGILTIFYSL
jgi:hypothetical protein